MINRAKYCFNRFTRVSLARGQTSPFSVQSVDGHYNCMLLLHVVLPYNCDEPEIYYLFSYKSVVELFKHGVTHIYEASAPDA